MIEQNNPEVVITDNLAKCAADRHLILPETGALGFIVGLNPSKGARSPRLWNTAFRNCQIDGEMFPLDISSEDVEQVAAILEQNSRVIGVAIAAPYKTRLAELFAGQLSPAAQKSGSINLLSRASNGRFTGSNTDGLAAVESLLESAPELAERETLVLGCGATGRAVIASLLDVVDPGRVSVAYRDPQHKVWLDGVGVGSLPISSVSSRLNGTSILINCTSLGWGVQSHLSPLMLEDLKLLPTESLVFDVVYQPDPTRLLIDARSLGLRTLSGGRMNLLQAVLAFCISNPTAERSAVLEAMRIAISE